VIGVDRIALPKPGKEYVEVEFAADGAMIDRAHLLGKTEIHAVNAANAAARPLLVRGEPGTGKSQLARAAAKMLGRAFVAHVVDSYSESRDLLWTFDAVKRLADAQIAGTLHRDVEKARAELAVRNYVHPGPLWWAFDWERAEAQCRRVGGTVPAQRDGGDWRNGTVVLLDEIDKAEPELPNGLLEALGAREFTPFGESAPVRTTGTPLVIITTNEERALPDAFVRRCLVLRLRLPAEETALIEFLIGRGRAHFREVDERVLRSAAELLCKDREAAIAAQVRPRPGQAEYPDLVRAVLGLEPQDTEAQIAMLGVVAEYTLGKHTRTDDAG